MPSRCCQSKPGSQWLTRPAFRHRPAPGSCPRTRVSPGWRRRCSCRWRTACIGDLEGVETRSGVGQRGTQPARGDMVHRDHLALRRRRVDDDGRALGDRAGPRPAWVSASICSPRAGPIPPTRSLHPAPCQHSNPPSHRRDAATLARRSHCGVQRPSPLVTASTRPRPDARKAINGSPRSALHGHPGVRPGPGRRRRTRCPASSATCRAGRAAAEPVPRRSRRARCALDGARGPSA